MSDADPVIADSGPLIALAMVGRLDLLKRLYGCVVVPDAVFEEVTTAGVGKPGASELLQAEWVNRIRCDPAPDSLLSEELGQGEAEAITLAVRMRARLLLIDDRRARRVAELAYRIRVRGVGGILLQAKRAAAIRAVRPILDDIQVHGYYLSPRIVGAVCREAGE